ncbi:MAG: hypothetical protein A2845_01785 [Candidatus Lloydbacteria bacterium RIFCSPHIGHO2_01_FULL_49_22]|uniref:Uncharacterized protein n=1 Tax=Candidatus Lloydbacteria bacterium RIFCSPHIGHO2_01_FULL_49_22 TaxID=1798658 RepID=A0A1G2CXY7_9BACT|nr:MAG: hypothetical protein A2845_01785 [Candidatus Lloydbacteria bacterium RIFCSPHIGHO2_01_FULL_49_22]OGZ10028.1 MAG: hypothetical protein A3C14_04950 [Candidatus Lloydbacteria bacterium RIFCSPHIGHO2_02_FULL_50_18]
MRTEWERFVRYGVTLHIVTLSVCHQLSVKARSIPRGDTARIRAVSTVAGGFRLRNQRDDRGRLRRGDILGPVFRCGTEERPKNTCEHKECEYEKMIIQNE